MFGHMHGASCDKIQLLECRRCIPIRPTCNVPVTTGYSFSGASGNITITSFRPCGVACAAGCKGSVSYKVITRAGTGCSVGVARPHAMCPLRLNATSDVGGTQADSHAYLGTQDLRDT